MQIKTSKQAAEALLMVRLIRPDGLTARVTSTVGAGMCEKANIVDTLKGLLVPAKSLNSGSLAYAMPRNLNSKSVQP